MKLFSKGNNGSKLFSKTASQVSQVFKKGGIAEKYAHQVGKGFSSAGSRIGQAVGAGNKLLDVVDQSAFGASAKPLTTAGRELLGAGQVLSAGLRAGGGALRQVGNKSADKILSNTLEKARVIKDDAKPLFSKRLESLQNKTL